VPKAVLWIRIGFHADPDPAFDLNADTDSIQGAKPMRIHSDPDIGQTLPSILLALLHEKYTTVRRHKSYLKGWKSGLFVNFGQFPSSWIRIPGTVPDPGDSNQSGYMYIRIHNTDLKI
jgi:hypothetical protein